MLISVGNLETLFSGILIHLLKQEIIHGLQAPVLALVPYHSINYEDGVEMS